MKNENFYLVANLISGLMLKISFRRIILKRNFIYTAQIKNPKEFPKN